MFPLSWRARDKDKNKYIRLENYVQERTYEYVIMSIQYYLETKRMEPFKFLMNCIVKDIRSPDFKNNSSNNKTWTLQGIKQPSCFRTWTSKKQTAEGEYVSHHQLQMESWRIIYKREFFLQVKQGQREICTRDFLPETRNRASLRNFYHADWGAFKKPTIMFSCLLWTRVCLTFPSTLIPKKIAFNCYCIYHCSLGRRCR